jgi:SAM-dependent methyltransferase
MIYGKVDIQAERVLIVAGGPSLRRFDFSTLAELPAFPEVAVLCVNRSILFTPRCDVWFTLDPDEKVQPLMRERRQGSRYFAAILDDFGTPHAKNRKHRVSAPEGITYVRLIMGNGRWCAREGLSELPGAVHTGNSAYGALGLAYLMGARKIALLGVDGITGPHFYEGDPARDLSHLPPLFATTLPQLQAKGIEVVNGSLESAVTCFSRDTPENAVRWLIKDLERHAMKVLYIGYYTRGNGYEAHARELIKTLDGFQLPHEIEAIDDRGGWQQNTQFKARFIQMKMEQHPDCALVWLDADARILQIPALFEEFATAHDCDLAVHYFRGHDLCSGTIYIAPTDEAQRLIAAWIEKNAQFPERWEQKNLQAVVEETHDARIAKLPAGYCYIFDLSKRAYPREDVVIEHQQASRLLKEGTAPAPDDPRVPHYVRSSQPSFEAQELQKRNGKAYSLGHQRMYLAPIELLKGKPDLKILEVGTGIGYGLSNLLSAGFVSHYYGVEPDKDSFQVAQAAASQFDSRRLTLFNRDWLSLIREEVAAIPVCDYAFCIEVIEHIPAADVPEFLAALRAHTRRGLFLSTPDAKTSKHGVATREEWARVLRLAGFQVASINRQWTTLFVCEP